MTVDLPETRPDAGSDRNPPPPARARRLRKLVASLAVVLAIFGLTAAAAPAASAAPATARVTVCFQNTAPGQYGTPWTREVKYLLRNPSTGTWHTYGRYASPNGCITWTVYAGYWTAFQVYEDWGTHTYQGTTGTYSFAPGTSRSIGYHRVYFGPR